MGLDRDINFLQNVGMFENFPVEQLRMLAFGAERLQMHEGELLFLQSQKSQGGYVVLSGEVELQIRAGENEIPVSNHFASSLLNETSLISENQCVTTAVCKTNCELLFIPRGLFIKMLEEYPELAILMHERIAASLKKLLSKIERVQQKMLQVGNLS